MAISAELERAACPLCPPGTRTEPRFDDPPFTVVRCCGCGLVFVSPRVASDRLPDVYGETYWRSPASKDHGYADYRGDRANWLRTYRLRADVLGDKIGPGARILDVGCAAGYFGQVMAERGHEVWGIEPSDAIVGEARATLGAERVHHGTLADAPFAAASFDLITLWDVIEHVADPVAALKAARRLLAPDGLLLLETQNVESRFARLLGRRWQHFKQLEHLWHFSPATVRRLVAGAGLEPLLLTSRRAGKYVGFDFIAERAGRVHPALPRLLSPVARLPGAVYINLFDEMILLARPASG